ncbi:PD40 domain-containing protein [Cytophaga aurantiaca]|uniref:PD40 domain-containing protein n=1 Tax=Cytophaga aurantiaca TaxID=29530 RepID=UPI000372F8CC|nr:PD40 domain-containing protein [Cytophaga aurantiaca]
MKFSHVLLIAFSFFSQALSAQVVVLKNPINTSMSDDFNPTVSGNGKTLIYEMVYYNTNKADVMISYQTNGVWSVPVVVPGVNTASEKLTNGGYFINHAGTMILFHSNRYKGIGGTDIWYVEKNATGGWSAPMNFGKPINTTGNELDPSISPDGKFMYYTVLSDKKTAGGLPCGKIMMVERISSTSWKEPVALPAPINGDCECGGKLLSDNKTFLFSSARAGGKGGYDFYKSTREENGTFSTPINYAFINTANDDKYISIAAGGSMLYSDAPGKGKNERDIIISKVPEDMQPGMVKLYQGKVTDINTKKPLAAQITVTHIKTGYTMTYRTAADGSFSVPVPASDDYDVGVFPALPGYEYISFYDPKSPVYKYEEKNVSYELKPAVKGSEIVLTPISINDDFELDTKSELELNRVKLFLKMNPTLNIHIRAYTDAILMDSVQHSNFDKEIINTSDSTVSYSNDYTEEEAGVIYNYLVKAGIPASRITFKGMGLNGEERKKKYVLTVQ